MTFSNKYSTGSIDQLVVVLLVVMLQFSRCVIKILSQPNNVGFLKIILRQTRITMRARHKNCNVIKLTFTWGECQIIWLKDVNLYLEFLLLTVSTAKTSIISKFNILSIKN